MIKNIFDVLKAVEASCRATGGEDAVLVLSTLLSGGEMHGVDVWCNAASVTFRGWCEGGDALPPRTLEYPFGVDDLRRVFRQVQEDTGREIEIKMREVA